MRRAQVKPLWLCFSATTHASVVSRREVAHREDIHDSLIKRLVQARAERRACCVLGVRATAARHLTRSTQVGVKIARSSVPR
jgi:hypothetical protein